MSLTKVGNNYVGELLSEIATTIIVGATDTALFHTKPAKGTKQRFRYLSVTTAPQVLESLCAAVDNSSRSRQIVNVELTDFIIQEIMCKDENRGDDVGERFGGFDPVEVAKWTEQHTNNAERYFMDLRWSGDTASGTVALTKHDGVIKKIKALNAYDATTNPTGYQKVTTTTITSSNAVQEIQKVYFAIQDVAVRAHADCKVVISQNVFNLLQQQVLTPSTTINYPKIMWDPATGQVIGKEWLGAPVHVCLGLDAVGGGNSNVVLAGIFADGEQGVLKYAPADGMEGQGISLQDVQDGDAVRFRIIHGQGVEIIPNGSQVAMNA